MTCFYLGTCNLLVIQHFKRVFNSDLGQYDTCLGLNS